MFLATLTVSIGISGIFWTPLMSTSAILITADAAKIAAPVFGNPVLISVAGMCDEDRGSAANCHKLCESPPHLVLPFSFDEYSEHGYREDNRLSARDPA